MTGEDDNCTTEGRAFKSFPAGDLCIFTLGLGCLLGFGIDADVGDETDNGTAKG